MLVILNSYFKISVARPEQGNAYLCKICAIHDHLPAKAAAYEFARILRIPTQY